MTPIKDIAADGRALMLILELMKLGYTATDIKSYAEQLAMASLPQKRRV